MSIFSGPVSHVSKTQILTSLVKPSVVVKTQVNGKTRYIRRPKQGSRPMQMVVYSNIVKFNKAATGEPTVMILPFPLIDGTNRVAVLDISKYHDIFSDMNKMFTKIKAANFDEWMEQSKRKSRVKNVGSYRVVVANNFAKLSSTFKKFNISANVMAVLKQYYSKKFGFMVCQLKEGAKFHPIAYVHEVRNDGQLFIPTRHVQGHVEGNPFKQNVEDYSLQETDQASVNAFMAETIGMEDPYIRHNIKKTTLSAYRDVPSIEWDHTIYIINANRVERDPLFKKTGIKVTAADNGQLYVADRTIKTRLIPKVALPKIDTIHKIEIFSAYKYNHDISI